jgi:hypothetical protein
MGISINIDNFLYNQGTDMSKSQLKTIFLILGVATWIFLFFSNWLWFEVARSPFTTKVYDVSRRMTSPDGKKSVILVRDYAFDLNLRLFIVDDVSDPAPSDFKDALWSSRDYNPDLGMNLHEDLEWSKDSSIIAVTINGEYIFAYDFNSNKKLEDQESIKQLLESRTIP